MFDIDKLRWINSEYIKVRPAGDLYAPLRERLSRAGCLAEDIDKGYLLKIIELYKTRFKTLNEFIALTECFFRDDYRRDEGEIAKYINDDSKKLLADFFAKIKGLNEFSAHAIEAACRQLAEEKGIKASLLIHPTRVAISGITKGAGLFEMMEVLGQEKVIERISRVCA
ncbi:MAG: hypothetical protein PHS37_00780 [Candidatus Omnitrophica bacterium]|nr:hypothetical protein [Candidatus Omnitrophota bacterium]